MKPNPGHCPPQAQGKRVNVIYANGKHSKASLAADGKQGCRWRIVGDDWDIREWETAE